MKKISKKSRLVALLLSIFLGGFGAHRFYAERYPTAILYLCTLGLFGFGTLYDIIRIALGEFKDSKKLPIKKWETE